ncbi:MAG TPA: ATP-binding protein [Opitutaceae bacterium]|nr:ATP-binding protein [Opitutaceae bacterium]HND61203.1 ATP-binding protein [Opitutaceae bacterium]
MHAILTSSSSGSLAEHDPVREYQELVDSLDDVVFRFDTRGHWSYLSPAWTRRLGWSIADCLGRPAVRFVHKDDRAKVLQSWGAVISGQQHGFRGEVRFRMVYGGERWMLVSARGLREANGTLRGVTGTLTDITAAKSAEAELIAARAAAESANKAKSEFLSTMSHELRTPLNSVIGLSESLLEFGGDFEPERTRRYLGMIHSSGRQLLAQINDILDLARIEAGRLKVNAELFDARVLCTAALESVQKSARAKQLKTESRYPAAPVFVRGDERLLRQAVQNLVSNAVKFTNNGGNISVVLTRLSSGATQIAVTDSGIGIPPDKLGLLFKPFSQVDSSLGRHFGGTGLGLALVDRIVRLHHGTVGVTSVPGQGSTFAFELPSEIRAPEVATPPTPRSRRVVLVDDDPQQHTLVGDFLRHHGFDVISFESALPALADIERVEPGLAIVDINMPGMTGLELIARLRKLPDRRGLPIIAATALAEADEAERCHQAGADVHLPKPISLVALAQHVARITHHTL